MSHDPDLLNKFGKVRISDRQVDELVGLAGGLCADGVLNQVEVEYLRTWLAGHVGIVEQPLLAGLYRRVTEILQDGSADPEECKELFTTLTSIGQNEPEIGEVVKSCTLPLCSPAPPVVIAERSFCFTGTFNFGGRSSCEEAVVTRGGLAGSLTRKTNYLVIGVYATESWKHSTFGNKILKAAAMRDGGTPISIISEDHWKAHLA